MMQKTSEDRPGIRVLRFLAKGGARLHIAAAKDRLLLDADERGIIAAGSGTLARLEQAGLVRRIGDNISLTQAGRSMLKDLAPAADLLQMAPAELEETVIVSGQDQNKVTINRAESPLALLYRRKGRNGQPFLDAREYRAGERLRSDYTRGQIMPRLGVNWDGAGLSGRSKDRAGGIHELTDAALAARQRVEKAIEAVGPEHAGVLIDICCFLKGMERVEAERSWPARSAKVVLKSALGALARHYEPLQQTTQKAGRPQILHWGAQDYRPKL